MISSGCLAVVPALTAQPPTWPSGRTRCHRRSTGPPCRWPASRPGRSTHCQRRASPNRRRRPFSHRLRVDCRAGGIVSARQCLDVSRIRQRDVSAPDVPGLHRQHGMAAMPDGGDRSEPDPTVRNASTQPTVGEDEARAMRAATIPHVEAYVADRRAADPGARDAHGSLTTVADGAPAMPVERVATAPHMGDRCAADPGARDAHGSLTRVADGAPAMSGGGTATLRHAEDCSASNVTVRGVPTVSENQAHETPLDPATARPQVEDRRMPGHVVRDAREALITAGHKMHEARAAVERALAQLDGPVTLLQLIRQALRCCAIAHR